MAQQALHLALAHHHPPRSGERTKGGGPGGRETFADLAHRIYQDPCAGHHGRELLLAVAYATAMVPSEDGGQWDIIAQLVGTDSVGRSRLGDLVHRDVPRYVSPLVRINDPVNRRCQAPRLRPFRTRLGPEATVVLRPRR